ncbi:MAG: FHA domain-containing protein, partial [Gammaproteobacteria bacterium]
RQDDAAQAEQERITRFRAVALPAMFRIHRKLVELVEQLRILGEEVPVTLHISGLGDVGGFVQGEYDVLAEGTPPATVTFRCALRLARVRPLDLKTTGTSINAWIDGMRRQGATMKVLRLVDVAGANQRAYVGFEGTLPATLQFTIDDAAGALQLYSRNFEEVADRRQFFSAASVTEQWCEELLKYVMRKPHSFLKEEVPAEIRAQLRRRIEWERLKEKGSPDAGDVPAISIKGLFRRTPQLRLTYGEQTFDLAAHAGPFTVGRVTDCDLQIKEHRVSRFHARIELRDGQFHLVDDSTNGTYVRFADGRAFVLKQTAIALEGDGTIGFGVDAMTGDPHLVRFTS